MIRALASAILVLVLTSCSRSPARTTDRRMIVLGIDGMDPDFLERHWHDLPNLDRLRKQGDFKRLATTIPPQSPVAWSTVATGLDPGGHGIYDFVHRDPETRAPFSSMADTKPPSWTVPLGPYLLPIAGGQMVNRRAGRTFWQILAEKGLQVSVTRIPANFPPAENEGETLAGMGTPDLEGSFGTFNFFTDDPSELRTEVPGGRIVKIRVHDGSAILRLLGPPNDLRKDRAVASREVAVYVDPTADSARFDLGDQQAILHKGEWSDWMHADFTLIPGLKSVSGIFRIYLQQAHPYVRIYVSPINIDPESPALPISTPVRYSRTLANQLGPFYTQGIAEETAAFRAGIFSKDEFLTQSRKVLADSLRMFHYQLSRFSSGLLFYYFSSVDQNSHMLWGKYESDLLEIYRGIDQAVGDAMHERNTTMLILSDHGFAPFNRAVHLNSWLRNEGFLTSDSPSASGDQEGFAHVDWSSTRAYALGLNGIYLNLEGREQGGIVGFPEKQQVLDDISKKLLAFRDPATGEQVVDRIYSTAAVFRGHNLKYAPDLIVGYRRGYRASWQTALGGVPGPLIENNDQAWIGDHCMAADEVPGVVLSNHRISVADPQMADIPVTILKEFGLPAGSDMMGRPLL